MSLIILMVLTMTTLPLLLAGAAVEDGPASITVFCARSEMDGWEPATA